MNQSNNNNSNNNNSNNNPNNNQNNNNPNRNPNGPRKGFQGRGSRPQGNRPPGGQQAGQAPQQGQGQGQAPQGQRPQGQGNPNQRRPHHRNHGNRPRNPNQNPNQHPQHQHPQQHNPNRERDMVFDRYEQLRNDHVAARKKYFEMFGTPDNNLKRKLEVTFNKTVEALSNYEATLQPAQRETLLKKIEMYKFDTTYSENRELIKADDAETLKPAFGLYPGLNDIPPEAPWQDPHFLNTQVNRPSFKEDVEESVGSIEDYKKLKGL